MRPDELNRVIKSEDCNETWVSHLTDVLDKLAKGDPAARSLIDTAGVLPPFLAEKLTRLAVTLEEIVRDSHEMAIGLCGHYDTLSRITAGEHTVRASLASPNELISRLGQLINGCADALQELSLKDPLTGLFNRRYLLEYEKKIVAGVLRQKKSIGLLMCDLDNFKQVNDIHGHDGGDTVLRAISCMIRKSVREADIVIRFGGEELLAILLDINEGDSMRIAEKVRAGVEQLRIQLADCMIRKTVSIGVSEFPDDADTLCACVWNADKALYQANELGRNRCVKFGGDAAAEGASCAAPRRALPSPYGVPLTRTSAIP